MNKPIPRLETPQTAHIRASYPVIEYLEEGYCADWLKERKDQLLELAREERSGINANKLVSGAVLAAGFFFHALSPLAPVGVVLGLIGYAHGCYLDATHNGSFSPLPFVRGNVLDIAGTLGNADLRERDKLNGDVDEFEYLQHYLPPSERKEYRLLDAHFFTLTEYLNQVEPLKRFHAYRWILDCFFRYQALPSPEQIQSHMVNVAADVRVDHTHLEAIGDRRSFLAERNKPRSIEQMGQITPMPNEEVKLINFAKPETVESLSPSPVTITETGKYNPSYSIDIVNELTERITNTLIIGVPGSGKGMLLANCIRAIKQKHPGHKIFVIDPKADPDESAYFQGAVDRYEPLACKDLPAGEVVDWLKSRFANYHEYVAINGPCLLILDEAIAVGLKLSKAGDEFLKQEIPLIASMGDKIGENIWVCSQTPFLKPLGLDLNSSSQMTVVAMLRETGTLEQWKPAGVKLAKTTQEDLKSLLKKSEQEIGQGKGRVLYFGKTGKWYAMPKLHNYSSYDRDTRTNIRTSKTPDALSEKDRAELRARTEAMRPKAQVQQTKKTSPESTSATKDIFTMLEESGAVTLGEFIVEDLRLTPDMFERTLYGIKESLETSDRRDLIEKFSDPYQQFGRWLAKLDHKPTDEEIKRQWFLLDKNQIDERGIKMIREKFGI